MAQLIGQIEKTADGVEQAVRRAGFGFAFQGFQGRMQQLVDDAMNGLLNGRSFGLSQPRHSSTQAAAHVRPTWHGPEIRVDCVRRSGKWHSSGVGRPASLKHQSERTGRKRSPNTGLSRQVFA